MQEDEQTLQALQKERQEIGDDYGYSQAGQMLQKQII